MERKAGIKILIDQPGSGRPVTKDDRVTITYSCYLHRGDLLIENHTETIRVGDRTKVAGFRYGLEGMQVGGHRRFEASPHLCYGEAGAPPAVPANAVLVIDIRLISVEEK